MLLGPGHWARHWQVSRYCRRGRSGSRVQVISESGRRPGGGVGPDCQCRALNAFDSPTEPARASALRLASSETESESGPGATVTRPR